MRLNKGREQQKMFSFFFFEQLFEKLRGNFLGNFQATCGKLEDWDLVHQTLSANRAGTMFDVCKRLQPPRVICSLYHTAHEKPPE